MGVVADFVRERQSYEEYSLSTEELYQKTGAPRSSVKKELARLVSDNQLVNLQKGFYLILPPRYQHYKRLPIELYVNKLFQTLDKPYYVSHYSATAFYSAAHQKVQQDYITTTLPAHRDIAKGNIQIRFFHRIHWPVSNIVQRKSDAGFLNISSPALTFVDLLERQNQLGGIHRMLAILEELAEVVELSDVKELLTWYNNKSALQRMGYLVEELDWNDQIVEVIFEALKEHAFFPTLLSPSTENKAGSAGNRWKVDANVELESDL